LGLDRDSGLVAEGSTSAIRPCVALLERAISACNKAGKYVGICGQGPSDHPDLAEWLMRQGIDSISLNPDTVVDLEAACGRGPAPGSGGVGRGRTVLRTSGRLNGP
jgi:phosphoenolpyruvate synthase/pyruvate phosphate dikinase